MSLQGLFCLICIAASAKPMPTRLGFTSPRPDKPAPLNQVQLDLLKLFERPLTAQQLQDIRSMLSQYMANQVDELGEQVWHEKKLTDKDMDKLLKSHVRTPYRK